VTKKAFVSFRMALDRLSNAASDHDPIFIVYDNGSTSEETTPREACARPAVMAGTKELAHRLKIRFWGDPDGRNSTHHNHKLLEGTLLDMVRERENRSHDALPVASEECRKACCNNGKPIPVRRQPTVDDVFPLPCDLDEPRRALAALRGDVRLLMVDPGGPGQAEDGHAYGLRRRYAELAISALEQAEIWLAMAAEVGE
jgi:hypothetical protein